MFAPALKKGSAELLILSILEQESSHGYAIAKRIEERSGGRLSFYASSLYPILFRMEKRGWIKGRWVEGAGKRRRFYSTTGKGSNALKRGLATWQEFTLGVNLILEPAHA